MSLFNIFDIAGSGLSAQSVRLNATASNIANAEAASSSTGEVYRGRHPLFAPVLADALKAGQAGELDVADPDRQRNGGMGVQVLGVVESNAPAQLRYEPDHPLADDAGYVAYPNVNVVEEMANMISASRSFQANVETLNSARAMAERLLTMGR